MTAPTIPRREIDRRPAPVAAFILYTLFLALRLRAPGFDESGSVMRARYLSMSFTTYRDRAWIHIANLADTRDRRTPITGDMLRVLMSGTITKSRTG